VRGIRNLVDEGVKVTVGFTPTRSNYLDTRRVVGLARELGAHTVNLSEFLPVGRGTLEQALPSETLRDLLHDWLAMGRELDGELRLTWHDCRVALLTDEEGRYGYLGCSAGVATCRITVGLDVTPCVALEVPAGNLREQPLMEIWRTSGLLARLRDRSSIQDGNCGTCDHKSACGGCRAVALAATGDLFGGDPYCWIVPAGSGIRRLPVAHERG